MPRFPAYAYTGVLISVRPRQRFVCSLGCRRGYEVPATILQNVSHAMCSAINKYSGSIHIVAGLAGQEHGYAFEVLRLPPPSCGYRVDDPLVAGFVVHESLCQGRVNPTTSRTR